MAAVLGRLLSALLWFEEPTVDPTLYWPAEGTEIVLSQDLLQHVPRLFILSFYTNARIFNENLHKYVSLCLGCGHTFKHHEFCECGC